MDKKEFIEAFEELKNSFVGSKVAKDKFSEEQIGMIKCWLDDVYLLGKEHGRTESNMERMGDDTFKRITEAFTSLVESGGRDLTTESLKSLLSTERLINQQLHYQVDTLLALVDSERFGHLTMATCCVSKP